MSHISSCMNLDELFIFILYWINALSMLANPNTCGCPKPFLFYAFALLLSISRKRVINKLP